MREIEGVRETSGVVDIILSPDRERRLDESTDAIWNEVGVRVTNQSTQDMGVTN